MQNTDMTNNTLNEIKFTLNVVPTWGSQCFCPATGKALKPNPRFFKKDFGDKEVLAEAMNSMDCYSDLVVIGVDSREILSPDENGDFQLFTVAFVSYENYDGGISKGWVFLPKGWEDVAQAVISKNAAEIQAQDAYYDSKDKQLKDAQAKWPNVLADAHKKIPSQATKLSPDLDSINKAYTIAKLDGDYWTLTIDGKLVKNNKTTGDIRTGDGMGWGDYSNY